MKIRNRIIIFLFAFGLILFGMIQGIVIPHIEKNEQKYSADQKDPLTHDFNSIIKYKNKYMGNASNIINLFYSLPLSDIKMSFQLFPDTLTAEVNYKETTLEIGEDKIKKSLIYNATAAFTLIDNLKIIEFKFTNASYKVLRSNVEKWYGVKLSSLAEKSIWRDKVQNKLNDNKYILKCVNVILQND